MYLVSLEMITFQLKPIKFKACNSGRYTYLLALNLTGHHFHANFRVLESKQGKIFPTASPCHCITTSLHQGAGWCWKVNVVRFFPLHHHIRVLNGVGWCWKVNMIRFSPKCHCITTSLSHCMRVLDGAGKLRW